MNQAVEEAWYFTRGGERIGPVGFAELQAKAGEAALDPRQDMVWKQGMADWKSAGEIEGLFGRPTQEEPPELPALREESPALAPATAVAPEDAWFYTREGERIGPVNLAELKIKAGEAALDPRLDMVWTKGMAEWKPAGEIEGLFERRGASEQKEDLARAAGPYAPPKSGSVAEAMSREGGWPGARRRSFLFMTILFPFVWSFLFAFLAGFLASQLGPEIMQYVGVVGGALPLIAGVCFGLMRLTNLGMSRWWYLGNFVPFLNFWIGYRCFACPAGYAYHKKLDGPGIALAILYWLMFVVGILVMVAMVVFMFGMVNDPEMQKQFDEPLRILREKLATS